MALPVALIVLAIAPAGAAAVDCEVGAVGGGPSGWSTDGPDGDFEEAALLVRGAVGALRTDAFDGYGMPTINGTPYANPSPLGCGRQDRKQEIVFPAVSVGGVLVKPKLYADPRGAFGRQLAILKNPTAAPVTIDFGWDGNLGSDGDTIVDRSSSGNATADAADRWATSCDDGDADGCANVAGEARRDPELAHNWEAKSGKSDSADAVVLASGDGNFDVSFTGVTIQPGQTVAYMEIVTLAQNVQLARSVAQRADSKPGKYGVFRGLSKKEQKQLRNW
ncbi:MAG: hypothetical protein EXQ70_07250 [Solirubrobacterales bacterium]|nr:hypothetical protein [Solirubrobacterales bacterium]